MLEATKELIEIIPDDQAAIRYHATALIKTRNFQQAEEFLRQCPHTGALGFELAYALHRAGKNDQVGGLLADIINSEDGNLRAKYLQAQVLYKLQKCEDASKLYEQLVAEADDDEEQMDIVTNYIACLS